MKPRGMAHVAQRRLQRVHMRAPGVDERVRGALGQLVRDDGGHGIRLCIVVGARHALRPVLRRAAAEACRGAANERKPAHRHSALAHTSIMSRRWLGILPRSQ